MSSLPEESLRDTMDSAREYVTRLEELVKSVEAAEHQVESSASQSTNEVVKTFNQLSDSILDVLNKRKESLLSEISTIRQDGLAPLRACRDVIASKLANTKTYIAEGGDILRIGGMAVSESTEKFCEKASFLGSLPAVPQLEEVPYVSFQCNVVGIEDQIGKSVQSLGRVSRMGPVQITQMDEKPGALLVHWEEIDFEHSVDIHAFRLQYAYGDIRNQPHLMDTNFHDVYEGPDTQYLVRDLRPSSTYTFRVSCLVEGESDWSAWSLPRVGSSNITPFSWTQNNPNYSVTNEGKIACKISNESSMLCSCSAQFGPGHCIEFTVLECGNKGVEQGLVLCSGPIKDGSLMQPGMLFLNAEGSIFVDGVEKMMKLPPLKVGAKVCFLCELIREDKLRMHIGTADKTVIYDWTPVCVANETTPPKLYFAISFQSKGWKILVE
ncbi:hypothetical protein FOCC_FOCC014986 [Frankliniella occidentalis]|uniref:Cytokine receptor-like factor 3 n=1 Tax=Frankliniella occidentalis TaxID=133901 RepID=A0A6J1TKU2_FRAOC|nr:cytokine receptor-like factor 3 [Frankliniella occidentalis]XP_052130080.1 cytokine receptor-like factor 3 [Frankliniella occidentalis]KAE8739490.1 hypothetical protein FOCC_FOCC014986 [Frankliniella occidentalis]